MNNLDIGPFSCVSREQYVNHGVNGRYRVVLYGAYGAHGVTTANRNGVGILIEPKSGARGAVVCDGLGEEAPGHTLPSTRQIELYESIVRMPWKQFQATVNHCANKRFKL